MRIANPIYDVVFKYLMEDLVIAQALLSVILNIEIVSLEIKPQELSSHYSGRLSLVRIDFKAIIRLSDGTLKIILIELQKSKKGLEHIRFRRYLALNYSTVEQILNDRGEIKEISLPITTIYFLGFRLKNINTPILKVVREYYNAITNRHIKARHNFIETLSHDLYAIQIPRLNKVARTEMEKMLDVFSQLKYKTDDNKVLEYTSDTDNPMVERMLNRLNMALLDQELIRKMQFEEEVEMEFAMVQEKLDEALKIAEQERKQKEEERKQKEELKLETEFLKKQLAEMKKLLDEKSKK
jgi:hypothetical protein